MWRRVLAVAAAAAVAVALLVAVLVDFPSFHGGSPHLPALGPTSSPAPGGLANPSPQPGGAESNPQAGPHASGHRLTGGGSGAADVEDEPPDVEDEPQISSRGVTTAPTPAPAPGVVGQNLLPSAPALPKPSPPALPVPTSPIR